MKRRELRVVEGTKRFPFAIGPLVEALQAAGVPTDDAMRIAVDVERHYRHRGDRTIAIDDLMGRLVRLAAAEAGVEAAQALERQT
ncbi:MAG: hypothetical protein P1P87_17635, partial [Trueperaceae bacterium]|nr:hypothetical protein [Trueperaceae bacterium]